MNFGPILPYVSNAAFVVAAIGTAIIVFLIAVGAFIVARRKASKEVKPVIVPEYEPPAGIGPIFAHYLLKKGSQGRVVGDMTTKSEQMIALISLYEAGLMERLSFIDESTVEYKLADTISMPGTPEGMLAERIRKVVGTAGTFHEKFETQINRNRRIDNGESEGFGELLYIWFDYWNMDLNEYATTNGYLATTKKGLLGRAFQWFAMSIGFGWIPMVVVSAICVAIPNGIFVIAVAAALIYLPITAVFGILLLIVHGLSFLGFNIIVTGYNADVYAGMLTITAIPVFIEWIVMLFLLSASMSTLNHNVPEKGNAALTQIKGYREYLRTVDADRLSVTWRLNGPLSKEQTSFGWLVVFKLVKDAHWQQWLVQTGSRAVNNQF